jgi:KUP system potassium uptake protein
MIFRAYNPVHAVNFISSHGIRVLGGVLLSITGVEAIFTNVSHYNRASVRWTFTLIVYPCLIMTYLGQAAALWTYPEWIENAFYYCIPGGIGSPGYWIVLILATMASVIASQAMILCIFSIVSSIVSEVNLDLSSDSNGYFSIRQDCQYRSRDSRANLHSNNQLVVHVCP